MRFHNTPQGWLIDAQYPCTASVAVRKSPLVARSPFFGRLEVPAPRVSYQGLRALCGDGVGVSQIPVTGQGFY
jgi:hypothetical protein